VINGQAITVTGAANQTVALPNGSAIINEQTSTIVGTAGELVVNALRVLTHDTIAGQPIADVALATADARIDCQGGSASSGDFVTGGGWIVSEDGLGKATFGFVAGPDNLGGFRGHLVLKDHSTGSTIQSNVIFSFTECNADTPSVSEFMGNDTNNQTFDAKAGDNGGPGTSDTFSINATDQNGAPYMNGPRQLGGGNIQAHGFTCP